MAVRENYDDNKLINGTSSADSIFNTGSKVTISGGDGSDTVDNGDWTVIGGSYIDSEWKIRAGSKTSLFGGSKVSINGGKGDDAIENYGSNVSISGGSDNDYVENYRSNVLISGDNGNDRINNYLLYPDYYPLTADLITAPDNSTLLGGEGDDYIFNEGGSNVSINGGAGDDRILNYYLEEDYINSKNVTIDGGDGNDFISNGELGAEGSNNVSINAGSGNDTVYNNADNATIKTGAGNDSIKNVYSDSVAIDAGAGNDSIYNAGIATIDAGAGNDSIYNYNGRATINAGAGNDTINNQRSSATIDAGAGNDSIYNNGDAIIYAGAGDDTVSLGGHYFYTSGGYAKFVTIDGGTGNDFICAEKGAESVSINGGEGNDTISCPYAKDVTIIGGKGNDLISIGSGTNNLIKYSLGDGKDTIYGFNDDDSIQLLTDSKIAANMNGNDAIFKVDDTAEAITLKDVLSGGSAQIKILYKTGELTTYTFNKNTGIITNENDSITLTSPFSGTFDASNYNNVTPRLPTIKSHSRAARATASRLVAARQMILYKISRLKVHWSAARATIP